MADYYKTLGVARGASEKDIRSAFRKLARKHHPDVNDNDPASEEKFKEINEAYSVLSDADSRQITTGMVTTGRMRTGSSGPAEAADSPISTWGAGAEAGGRST